MKKTALLRNLYYILVHLDDKLLGFRPPLPHSADLGALPHQLSPSDSFALNLSLQSEACYLADATCRPGLYYLLVVAVAISNPASLTPTQTTARSKLPSPPHPFPLQPRSHDTYV